MNQKPSGRSTALALLLGALITITAGCGGSPERNDPPGPWIPTTAAPPPNPTTTAARSVLPDELIGTWVTVGGGDAERSYHFNADGSYQYTGVLRQQRATGLLTVQVAVAGSAIAIGDQLRLQPIRGTVIVEDPDIGRKERAADTTIEVYSWRIDGRGMLIVTGSDGGASQFRRQR